MTFTDRIKRLNYGGNYYLILAVLFCIALRVLTPQMIGFGGGDAIESWDMARRILFNTDYYVIHRTARFGTVIPVYLTQLLLGIHPLVYYVAPAVASIIQTVFLYKTANLIRGRSFAFISTILYLSFPQTIRDMSHPRVSVFSIMFFLIAFYYALKFFMDSRSADVAEGPRRSDLIISGINIFFMYMSKEDSLYYLPAIMLMVYLSRKRLSDLIIFGILPFSMFICETCAYHFFTEFKYGRLSVITGKHFDTVTPLPSWLSLFDRFKGKNLRPYFRYPLFISMAGGIYLLIKKRYDDNNRLNPLVFVIISLFLYVFFMTFLVKSTHPVVPLNTFRTRYMNIIIPPMILIITYMAYGLCAVCYRPGFFIAKKNKLLTPFIKYGKLSAFLILLIYTVMTVVIFFSVYKKEAYKSSTASYFELHPFKLIPEYYRQITGQYTSGKPFLIRGKIVADDRFAPVVDTIDEWIKSGIKLEDACTLYGITVEEYKKYKKKTDAHISFNAASYATRVFIHPDSTISGFESFDKKISGKLFRICYNKNLTGKEKIIKELERKGETFPELAHPPMSVFMTKLTE